MDSTNELNCSTTTSTWQELRATPRYCLDDVTRVRIESRGKPPAVAVLVDECPDGIGVLCSDQVSFQVADLGLAEQQLS